jgi:hypothetical protein
VKVNILNIESSIINTGAKKPKPRRLWLDGNLTLGGEVISFDIAKRSSG